MSLIEDRHQNELRAAGWHSRGYLPHFDGIELPQFITFHLADSMPRKVIERWRQELKSVQDEQQKLLLIRRVEKYLDQGYGEAFLKDTRVAGMVQNSLMKFDGLRYRLFAWVVMPNHMHSLMTRFENYELKDILHSLKSTQRMKLIRYSIAKGNSGSTTIMIGMPEAKSTFTKLLSTLRTTR